MTKTSADEPETDSAERARGSSTRKRVGRRIGLAVVAAMLVLGVGSCVADARTEQRTWETVRDEQIGQIVCVTSQGSVTRWRNSNSGRYGSTRPAGFEYESGYFASVDAVYYTDRPEFYKAQVGSTVKITAADVDWRGSWGVEGYVRVTGLEVLDDGTKHHCGNS